MVLQNVWTSRSTLQGPRSPNLGILSAPRRRNQRQNRDQIAYHLRQSLRQQHDQRVYAPCLVMHEWLRTRGDCIVVADIDI